MTVRGYHLTLCSQSKPNWIPKSVWNPSSNSEQESQDFIRWQRLLWYWTISSQVHTNRMHLWFGYYVADAHQSWPPVESSTGDTSVEGWNAWCPWVCRVGLCLVDLWWIHFHWMLQEYFMTRWLLIMCWDVQLIWVDTCQSLIHNWYEYL